MKVFFQKLHMRILYVLKYRKKFRNKDGTGPMAIYIDTRSKRKRKQDEDNFNQFLDFASRKITPNRKKLSELISYIETNYGAEQYTIEPRAYRLDLFNLLKNDYADVFDDPILQDFDFVDLIKEQAHRSIESQRRVDYLFDKIKDYKLNFLYYRFIDNPDSLTEEDKYFKVGIETTSGKLLMDGHGEASRETVEDISLYYGVAKNDIRNRSNTFIAYAIYLRDRGMLVQ